MNKNMLVLLYRASQDLGTKSYEVLEFFAQDMEFCQADYWQFYEKKYLLTSVKKSLCFDSYEELEAFGIYVGQELGKESLNMLDNLTFNQAVYHAGSMEQAISQIEKNDKLVTLGQKKGLKTAVFGRIFRA